jgi:hypothetical protein
MKKRLYFILALLLFTLFTCKDDTNNPNNGKPGDNPSDTVKTLDQRLVGGRWYFPKLHDIIGLYTKLEPDYSLGYYEFINSKLIYSDRTKYFEYILGGRSNKPVYSDNGIIYGAFKDAYEDAYIKVMQYEFHTKFPYSDNDDFYIMGDDRFILNRLALEGNLISYQLFNYIDGTKYDNGTNISWWFLVRYTEYDDPND